MPMTMPMTMQNNTLNNNTTNETTNNNNSNNNENVTKRNTDRRYWMKHYNETVKRCKKGHELEKYSLFYDKERCNANNRFKCISITKSSYGDLFNMYVNYLLYKRPNDRDKCVSYFEKYIKELISNNKINLKHIDYNKKTFGKLLLDYGMYIFRRNHKIEYNHDISYSVLQDSSSIIIMHKKSKYNIDLAALQLLKHGVTYYESVGFFYEFNKKYTLQSLNELFELYKKYVSVRRQIINYSIKEFINLSVDELFELYHIHNTKKFRKFSSFKEFIKVVKLNINKLLKRLLSVVDKENRKQFTEHTKLNEISQIFNNYCDKYLNTSKLTGLLYIMTNLMTYFISLIQYCEVFLLIFKNIVIVDTKNIFKEIKEYISDLQYANYFPLYITLMKHNIENNIENNNSKLNTNVNELDTKILSLIDNMSKLNIYITDFILMDIYMTYLLLPNSIVMSGGLLQNKTMLHNTSLSKQKQKKKAINKTIKKKGVNFKMSNHIDDKLIELRKRYINKYKYINNELEHVNNLIDYIRL